MPDLENYLPAPPAVVVEATPLPPLPPPDLPPVPDSDSEDDQLDDDTEEEDDEDPENDDAPPADTQPPWSRDDTVPRHQEAQGSGAASSADAAPTVTEPTVPDPPVQDPPAPSPFRSASYVNREQERLARRRARSDRLRAWEGWPEPCDLLDGDATVVWTLPNGVNPQPVPAKYANYTPARATVI